MNASALLLVLVSLAELALLSVVIVFFLRLRKSEALVHGLQSRQGELLRKLQVNAQLERELVDSFRGRQEELARLDQLLEERTRQLSDLVKQAEGFTRSPRFLRQVILAGHGEGKPTPSLARATGLSVEEVELIISQAGN
ncbi:MAG TPA: hypothetical protein PKB11_01285 [Desulfovibrio sp.]|jgi:uncharacterized protein HemX|uniref:hypothetical protein n=1 Tax=Desulfovibrio TaxID=872 RepID=UPI000424C950|nr:MULTISPECIES: hypothetical protein [Desulfovibrio]MDY0306248.1 hypothetical protein [Desulfovibrionaceae bacterium]HMM37365.1 hypothetical protein [Desulfovibrio sp.]